MTRQVTSLVVGCVLLFCTSCIGADDEGFEARRRLLPSLTVNRVANGQSYVNGTMNIAVTEASLGTQALAAGVRATTRPAAVVDQAAVPVDAVNVVVKLRTPLIILLDPRDQSSSLSIGCFSAAPSTDITEGIGNVEVVGRSPREVNVVVDLPAGVHAGATAGPEEQESVPPAAGPDTAQWTLFSMRKQKATRMHAAYPDQPQEEDAFVRAPAFRSGSGITAPSR